MSEVEQTAVNLVEIVKSAGPYTVAIIGMAFGYLQSRKTVETQREIAKITKEKDLEIANIQSLNLLAMEELKNSKIAVSKLQNIYSPMYAKVESICHKYVGVVAGEKAASLIQKDLLKFVYDDYISLTVESRQVVLAEAIAICQMLKDNKAYEIAVQLDSKINEALSLVDITGKSSGIANIDKLRATQREYRLLYVSFFYKLANLK